MQYCLEIDITKGVASNAYTRLGRRGHVVGSHAEQSRLLRCSFCPWYDRKRSLSWGSILPFDVV